MTDSTGMNTNTDSDRSPYTFETGPIRPPSEAQSLLVRVSRNCPWNKCTFCPVYTNTRFSRRAVEDVVKDIDAMGRVRDYLKEKSSSMGISDGVAAEAVRELMAAEPDHGSIQQVALWLAAGGRTVFLQDANSLLIKPGELILILERLRAVFPEVNRVTSYARSHTLAKIPQDELKKLHQAGLNRIHVGLESGSDKVLKRVKKGCTKADHIAAGRKVIQAGIELSEYVIPGLGGIELTDEHADETADALNQIDPHFIRLRTLGLAPGTSIREEFDSSEFVALGEDGVVREIRRMIAGLAGVRSTIASDHILNLLEEVEGTLDRDRKKILGVIDRYLAMDEDDRLAFQLGRRLGGLRRLDELKAPGVRAELTRIVEEVKKQGPDNVLREILTRFI